MAKKKTSRKGAPRKSAAPSSAQLPQKNKAAVTASRGSRFVPALKNLKYDNIILLLILAAISAVIIMGPFQRGLFFQKELLPVHVISFALFTLWWIIRLIRRDDNLMQTPLDWCILALAFFYFLSQFGAVNRRAALEEFLKVANYAAIYLMVAHICKQKGLFQLRRLVKNAEPVKWRLLHPLQQFFANPQQKEPSPALLLFLHTLIAAAIAVAIGGLGTAAGTWELHGAYVDERIHTSLQYPNTAAAYLTAAFFLTLGVTLLQSRRYLRPLYLAPATILLLTIIFTFSRGAWLLLPFLAIIFILLMVKGERLRVTAWSALTVISVLLVMQPLDAAIHTQSGQAWVWICSSAFMAVAGGLILELFLNTSRKVKIITVSASVLLLLGAGLYLILPRLAAPVYLETPPGTEPARQYLEQRVNVSAAGATHQLTAELFAEQHEDPQREGAEEPAYAWRLEVLGYDLENERHRLLRHQEGPTEQWETKELEFTPDEEIQRLEIRLYNTYPGTAVTARNIVLDDGTATRKLNFAFNKLLPRSVYDRIFAIGMGERVVVERFVFFEDAFAIAMDYPVLGAGGGAWETLYFAYQQYRYFTTEVHNHFLQVWVEAGTLGFLAFAGIWLSLLLAFYRNYRNAAVSDAKKKLWTALLVSAGALGAHSVIDFNLSLGAVSLFLFALFGVVRSLDNQLPYPLPSWLKWRNGAQYFWVVSICGLIIAFLLFFNSYTLWQGHRLSQEAAARANANELSAARHLFEEASRLDPLQAANYADLASILEHLATLEDNQEMAPQLRGRVLELTEKTLELEPYNREYVAAYGRRLLSYGRIDEGIQQTERLLELHPRDPGTYVSVARSRLSVAEYYMQNEQEEEAEQQLQSILKLEPKMDAYLDEEYHSAVIFFLGQASFLLGETEAAVTYFARVEEDDMNYQQALVFQKALLEKKGEQEEALQLEEQISWTDELQALYQHLLFAE